MNVHGIPFKHRRPWDLREFVSRDFAQFTVFAALLKSHGVAHYVTSVDYETEIQSFVIETVPDIEQTDVGGAISWCADKALSQYFLFGYCAHKNSLEDEL